MPDLILASASPRRVEMLRNIGIDFRVVPSNVEENPAGVIRPIDLVRGCAQLKTDAVSKTFPDSWVLGADTIVVINGEVLGKPVNDTDAVRMLRKLSGRKHRVISAFCVAKMSESQKVLDYVETQVWFKKLTDDEIRGYVSTGEPLDKAGAYGIQGIGCFLVKEIKGSYTNVVGLPLAEVVDVLVELGACKPFEKSSRQILQQRGQND